MARVAEDVNRNADDIRALAAIVSNFRAEVARDLGALIAANIATGKQFDKMLEMHVDLLKKVDEHGKGLDEMRGGMRVMRWVGSAVAALFTGAGVWFHFRK